ncbi:hypothetical protein AB0E08_17700 [Streptomyces sp. NPDC048281]|uniref:DUF6924 domain-containing protein n=1 Tax=Streptomyces sp. NPDC048281 TaxID=3154715 RepID=UPI003435678E
MSDDLFAFLLWQREPGSGDWRPAPRLRVRLGNGGVNAPAQLCWVTDDGRQSAVSFSPDMEICYGHRRTTGGAVQEIRGQLYDRQPYPGGTDGARGYEFDAETEDAGVWNPAGQLRMWIDDGGEAPVRWASWGDLSGNIISITLCSVEPSDNADANELVSFVWADTEYREAGEVARNLVDPSASKWFAPRDHASLEFRLTRPIALDRYVLTSADDAPDRDPSAWTLRGSADGHSWRTLDVRSGQSFAERHQSRTYRIAEPGFLAGHYRLDITGNHGSPHLQLESVRFLIDGSGRFVGYRRRAGCAPVPYRGTHTGQAPPDLPTELPPQTAPVPGGSWLPLGGRLSMESLTSPSGRFTVLHSVYDPSLAVRDNATQEQVWNSDSPKSHLVCLGPDGDLVAWDHRGNRVWSTGTAWLGVRRLEMRDNGELALTDAHGTVVWSSGIPQVGAAGAGRRSAARGSTMRRGEGLHGQSLTSDDGSTVLFHGGRTVQNVLMGRTAHWTRFHDQQTTLVLDDDGFLRSRALDGAVLEEIAGPGAELVVVRGAAELRDDAGAVVWASDVGWDRPPPVREPAVPHNDVLAAWFSALAGEDRGYCVAVVKDSTPQEVLRRAGLAEDMVTRGTWRELQQRRDTAHPDTGHVVAALAAGPDVLLLTDDPALPVRALAPSASTAALHRPPGRGGFGGTFSLHQDDRLVTELRDDSRRHKGAKVAEVATALDEIAHELHRHELLFRVFGVVPAAAALGGPLLGGVLTPKRSPSAGHVAEPARSALAIEGFDDMNPLVVRTDFTDENAWQQVVEELQKPWPDHAEPVDPHLVSAPGYADASVERVLRDVHAALAGPNLPEVVFIADGTTMRAAGHPLLAVSTEWDGEPFGEDEEEFVTHYRVLPGTAVEISVNVALGNMDFEDFDSGDEAFGRTV